MKRFRRTIFCRLIAWSAPCGFAMAGTPLQSGAKIRLRDRRGRQPFMGGSSASARSERADSARTEILTCGVVQSRPVEARNLTCVRGYFGYLAVAVRKKRDNDSMTQPCHAVRRNARETAELLRDHAAVSRDGAFSLRGIPDRGPATAGVVACVAPPSGGFPAGGCRNRGVGRSAISRRPRPQGRAIRSGRRLVRCL